MNLICLFVCVFLHKIVAATDLEKRISDAFLIFDHQNNKTVDVREIGTILRYLGELEINIECTFKTSFN